MLDENENEIDDFSITEDEGFLQELIFYFTHKNDDQ